MTTLKLFFSWQSDIHDNHRTIADALKKACDEIRTEGEYDILYDESLMGESGSPKIVDVVLRKIKECDIYVADLTPITRVKDKLLPNSNVMMELGVAKVSISDNAILLLHTDDVDSKCMPFDINHNRLSKFNTRHIKDYVLDIAKFAATNPRHRSIFDDDDQFLHYDNNLVKNLKSRKYLPNVYLEDRGQKQKLRDFVAPYLFCKRILEQCASVDTYKLNLDRKRFHLEEFVFDTSQYNTCVAEETITNFYSHASQLRDYLLKTHQSLTKRDSDYLQSSKYGRWKEHLDYILGRVLLVTSYAGQGKTNMICDLVDHVFIKRNIPFVYLNGYEIKADDVYSSFANAMCPGSGLTFTNVIKEVDIYCKRKRTPIIFIIDGLNENPDPVVFERNLEQFLDLILKFDCVKVIMTCRTEYYEKVFKPLDDKFSDAILRIQNFNDHLSEENKHKLLDNYLRYFNITADITDGVEESLTSNMLLLRIFCEAYEGKTLGWVYSIKRKELFAEYYEKMCDKLIEKVRNENNYELNKNVINVFIETIIKYMIDNSSFENVPFSYLDGVLNEYEKKIFYRFLDENILLRKDLTPESRGVFAQTEVVNFTYDAFRDYLISAYMLEKVMPADMEKFKSLVKTNTASEHKLREGLTTFLFVHSKQNNQIDAHNFLKTLDWYNEAFNDNIWDIDDRQIDAEDIARVKANMKDPNKGGWIAQRLIYFGRWNTQLYPNLNITVLLEHLSSLNDDELNSLIDSAWSEKTNSYIERNGGKSRRQTFVESLVIVMDDERKNHIESFHNLYKILLYLTAFSGAYATNSYLKYMKRFNNKQQFDEVLSVTASSKVILKVNQLKAMV